ncbi:MAG: amidohydrolase family protein, partial [Chloroflexi bacterium]|nr:amidohydrolase family protein [Chloroflexota bacterium]
MSTKLSRLVSVAKGERPADLILANARVVNTFTGEIETGNVAICGERIAGVGDYQRAKQVLDLSGKYLAPGLINGHTHLESSMLDIGQYARAVVARGTSAVVTDLHEIANVCGLAGMRYVLDSARRLPLDLFLMAPSCVPATHLETSGANIGLPDIRRILKWPGCIGLGEVMNFPGVLGGDAGVLGKIALAGEKPVDGHAPGVTGKDLDAYIAAGINSDHESVTLAEAAEKLAKNQEKVAKAVKETSDALSRLNELLDRTAKKRNLGEAVEDLARQAPGIAKFKAARQKTRQAGGDLKQAQQDIETLRKQRGEERFKLDSLTNRIPGSEEDIVDAIVRTLRIRGKDAA